MTLHVLQGVQSVSQRVCISIKLNPKLNPIPTLLPNIKRGALLQVRDLIGSKNLCLGQYDSFLRSIVYCQYYNFHHIGPPRYYRYLINLVLFIANITINNTPQKTIVFILVIPDNKVYYKYYNFEKHCLLPILQLRSYNFRHIGHPRYYRYLIYLLRRLHQRSKTVHKKFKKIKEKNAKN